MEASTGKFLTPLYISVYFLYMKALKSGLKQKIIGINQNFRYGKEKEGSKEGSS